MRGGMVAVPYLASEYLTGELAQNIGLRYFFFLIINMHLFSNLV